VKAEMNLAPWMMRHRSSAQLRAILEPKQINFARDYDLIATIRTVVFLLAGKLDFIQLNPHARRMHAACTLTHSKFKGIKKIYQLNINN
jgi:hypothetical protein